MRLVSAICCLLAVTACFHESPTAPGPIDAELTLAPGQSAPIPGTHASLRFVGVTGDNRCPADVVCILGGSATVSVRATVAGTSRGLTFETGDPKPVVQNSLTLELVRLQPYPFSTKAIQPEEYRATFRVRR